MRVHSFNYWMGHPASDPATQVGSLVGLISNPVTHLIDDAGLIGAGALEFGGTLAFDAYLVGETGGVAGGLLISGTNPALLFGSYQTMKTGFEKAKSDLNELSATKPGC